MLDPRIQSVPAIVTSITIQAWARHGGKYPAVIAYQWKEEFSLLNLNWAYGLAWAAVHTDHFSHPSWVHSIKLPSAATGEWPEHGSRTMRAEIRHLAITMAALLKENKPEVGREKAYAEYEKMLKIIHDSENNHRPEPPKPPTNPAPMPPPPRQPKPPPVPPPPKNEKPNWGLIGAILVPIITLIIWIVPMPEWIKAILRLILQAIGAGG